jgi:hypothetical protein
MSEPKRWCNHPGCSGELPHCFPITKCRGCGDAHLPQHWGDSWCDDCKVLPRAGLTNWELEINEGGPREVTRKDGTVETVNYSPSVTSRMSPAYWSPVRFDHYRYMPTLFFHSVEQRDEALALLREHFA